jgi:hypothetical protein
MLNSGSKKRRNPSFREINPFADPRTYNPVAFTRSIRGYHGLCAPQQHIPHLNVKEGKKIKIVAVSSSSVKEEISNNSSNIIANEDEKTVVIQVSINFK